MTERAVQLEIPAGAEFVALARLVVSAMASAETQLSDDRVDDLPAHFSKGMRQKTSIALGLARPFQLLLADEPFDGLDPPSREVLTDLLSEAAASGAAVVVSTHRLDIAERASRCIALFDGQVTYDGPADQETMHKLLP